MAKNVRLNCKCRVCQEPKALFVSQEGIDKYKAGHNIQNCFPFLSADDRELLISGVCGKCFDNMFAGMDEE